MKTGPNRSGGGAVINSSERDRICFKRLNKTTKIKKSGGAAAALGLSPAAGTV